MTKLIAALLLLLFTLIFSGFSTYGPKPSNLIFTDFKILSRNEREVRLAAFTDNSGIKQTTEILVTIKLDSLLFLVTVLPNDRNVNLYYKSSIPLK